MKLKDVSSQCPNSCLLQFSAFLQPPGELIVGGVWANAEDKTFHPWIGKILPHPRSLHSQVKWQPGHSWVAMVHVVEKSDLAQQHTSAKLSCYQVLCEAGRIKVNPANAELILSSCKLFYSSLWFSVYFYFLECCLKLVFFLAAEIFGALLNFAPGSCLSPHPGPGC